MIFLLNQLLFLRRETKYFNFIFWNVFLLNILTTKYLFQVQTLNYKMSNLNSFSSTQELFFEKQNKMQNRKEYNFHSSPTSSFFPNTLTDCSFITFINQGNHFSTNIAELSIHYQNHIKNSSERDRIRKELCFNELYHEREIYKLKYEACLVYSIIPSVTSIKPGEPLLIIDIIKSFVPLEAIQTRFIVTPRGMVNSLKKPKNGQITIGRQQIQENGFRPNDIMLNPNDSSISRVHAAILYKNGLIPKGLECPDFMTFLLSQHPKCTQKSLVKRLPLDILRYIFSFVKEKKAIYASDLSSICGTYIRVKNIYTSIESKNFFLIGYKFGLNIIKVYNSGIDYIREFKENNDIHDERQLIQKAFGNLQIQYRPYISNNSENTKNWSILTLLNCRCLLLGITSGDVYNAMPIAAQYILCADANPNHRASFYCGPHDLATIHIPSNTMIDINYDGSRNEYPWALRDCSSEFDGSRDPNYNHYINNFGLWKSLSDYKETERFKPKWREVKNGDEIKISETILRLKWGDDIKG